MKIGEFLLLLVSGWTVAWAVGIVLAVILGPAMAVGTFLGGPLFLIGLTIVATRRERYLGLALLWSGCFVIVTVTWVMLSVTSELSWTSESISIGGRFNARDLHS